MLPSSSGVVRPAAAVPVPLGPVEPVSLDDDSVMPPLEHPAAVGSAAQKRTAADAEDGLTTTLLHVARRVRANSMPGAPSLSSSPADSLSAAAAAVASKSSARPPPILTHGSDTDDRDSLPSSHSHSMRPERLLTQFSQTPFKTLRVNLQRPGSVSIENPFLGTAQQTQRSQAQSTVTVAVRLMGEPTRDKLYFVAKDVVRQRERRVCVVCVRGEGPHDHRARMCESRRCRLTSRTACSYAVLSPLMVSVC